MSSTDSWEPIKTRFLTSPHSPVAHVPSIPWKKYFSMPNLFTFSTGGVVSFSDASAKLRQTVSFASSE